MANRHAESLPSFKAIVVIVFWEFRNGKVVAVIDYQGFRPGPPNDEPSEYEQ